MPRGGKREGAGRRAKDGARAAAKITVNLTEAHLNMLEDAGGNISVALRSLLDELLRYRNSGTVLTSITNPGTARAILKRPVRAEVPDRAPDGRKYGITKMLELEAAADAAYAAAMKKWEAAQ